MSKERFSKLYRRATRKRPRALDYPEPGKWPCQTRAYLAPSRLISALYLLLRDEIHPGDLEQVLINVVHANNDDFTNPHLEQLARSLATYLLDGPVDGEAQIQ